MFENKVMQGLIVAAFRILAGILILPCLVVTHAQAQTLTVLATFNNGNGLWPTSDLTLIGSTLYGTTQAGGANGYGTVFSVPVSGGTPTVLASFNMGTGVSPEGDLTLSGNTLYGTTYQGGAYGGGTVYSLPVSGGSPTVLASFNYSSGLDPEAGLTLSGSTLYGTTTTAGGNEGGTVFSLPVSGGSPTVLASFNNGTGTSPQASLTLSGSTLYGTTSYNGGNGSGTVFSLPVTGGSPAVMASFDGNNGAGPLSALTLSGSTLYGTAQNGGFPDGSGTVFSLPVTGGSPTVLTTFNGSNAGWPQSALTLSGSTLYGTTFDGGAFDLGTVFSLPVSGGSATILASFNGIDGMRPGAGLTLDGNTLYGTTAKGGANHDGNVFALNLNGYAWNVAGGGSWATAANWSPAGPPDGVDNTADFSQQTLAANATVTLDGSHTIGNLVFGDQGNAFNWTLAAGSGGALTLKVSTGTPTITVNNQTATISAVVGGSQGLTKLGGGTLVLAASNVYTGGTTVSAGTLQLGDGVANNGYVQGNILNNAAVTFANPAAQTYAGVISGNGALTKVGSGVLALSGSNTYSGPTTINQGKLTVDGWLTNSAVSVNGGTLGGTGYLNSVTVNFGGQLAPGDSLGVMHLSGGLILESGAVMDYELDTPGTSDEISCGSLALNNQQFSDFHFTWSANFGPGSYDLIAFGSSSGSLASASGTIDGYAATLAVKNNDLVLAVVPEPSTATLLVAGVLGLIGWAWRWRRAKTIMRSLLAAALLGSAVSAQADVFNMGGTISGGTWTGLASLSFVTVGDPGNVADPATGYGAVPYV